MLFEFIRSANRYFDEQQPWRTIHEQPEKCSETLATCVFIIQNLSQLLQPFLPFACLEIQKMLGITAEQWAIQKELPIQLAEVAPIYERIDVKQIDEELLKLKGKSK